MSPTLHEHPFAAYCSVALEARPAVARVIDEARPYRDVFPLPWPAHVA